MERVITANDLQNLPIHWSEILLQTIHDYNHVDIHSALDMTPAIASLKENQPTLKEIWNRKFLNSIPLPKNRSKFHVGDYVRLYRWKGIFTKGYKANWSKEIFKIVEILPTNPFTYKISDSNDEIIEGSVYEQEMAKTAFTF